MGMIVTAQSSSIGGLVSMVSSVGVGFGGIFVTALLVYLLGYLNVVDASERTRQQLHELLVVASIPLLTVFAGIVVYESLAILGHL